MIAISTPSRTQPHARRKKRDLTPEGTRIRALRYAAKLLGGVPTLAKRLGVLPAAVDGWLNGKPELPDAQFLLVVDIVLDHNGRPRG